jgi:hypothetical protein
LKLYKAAFNVCLRFQLAPLYRGSAARRHPARVRWGSWGGRGGPHAVARWGLPQQRAPHRLSRQGTATCQACTGCPATCHTPTGRPATCHAPTGRPATCHASTGRPATCHPLTGCPATCHDSAPRHRAVDALRHPRQSLGADRGPQDCHALAARSGPIPPSSVRSTRNHPR